jgi:cysteine desulfuration protein SufE
MSEMNGSVPPRLQEIIEDFGWAQGREKLELLLEYSESMPELPGWLHDRRDGMEAVPECMTPVFIHVESDPGSGKMTFYFDVPPESPTVRGYAEILRAGAEGATPEEVLAIPNDFFRAMGLHQVLSPQRMNGISAILAHMKRLAVQELENRGQ